MRWGDLIPGDAAGYLEWEPAPPDSDRSNPKTDRRSWSLQRNSDGSWTILAGELALGLNSGGLVTLVPKREAHRWFLARPIGDKDAEYQIVSRANRKAIAINSTGALDRQEPRANDHQSPATWRFDFSKVSAGFNLQMSTSAGALLGRSNTGARLITTSQASPGVQLSTHWQLEPTEGDGYRIRHESGEYLQTIFNPSWPDRFFGFDSRHSTNDRTTIWDLIRS
jgi:hypothetical protein